MLSSGICIRGSTIKKSKKLVHTRFRTEVGGGEEAVRGVMVGNTGGPWGSGKVLFHNYPGELESG